MFAGGFGYAHNGGFGYAQPPARCLSGVEGSEVEGSEVSASLITVVSATLNHRPAA
jgi:hypothetical protein